MRDNKSRPTRNVVPFGTVGDAILKMFIRVNVTTRDSIVHQRILLHTDPTQAAQALNNVFCAAVQFSDIIIFKKEQLVFSYLRVGQGKLAKDFVIR